MTLTALPVIGFAQRPEMLPYVTIDQPTFVPAAGADFMQDDYVVLGITSGKVAKAYPAADLAQHGSALDVLPDGPVTVTWCGVCNVGAVYRRNLDGLVLHFDYDSMVFANEVQKDRETGSRWQQALGEAIDGPLKGKRLTPYLFTRTSWGEWKRQHPGTLVMQPQPGYAALMPLMDRLSKGAYVGEGEAPAKSAFPGDYRVRPRELVAGLQLGTAQKAYPFSALRAVHVVNDQIGGKPVLIVHQPGSDTTTAFVPRARGRTLTFDATGDDATGLIDRETHSHWTAYGKATAGSMKGAQLERLMPVPQFWFAWVQFHPQTELFTAASLGTGAVWEPLLRVDLPADAMPKLTAQILRVKPAPATGPNTGTPAHQHAAPVLGYVLRGQIDNEVEPDPVRIYSRDGFFYEPPAHVHRSLHNLSSTETAEILVFMGGDPGKNATPLIEVPLGSTTDQDLGLLRMTLGAGATITSKAHSGPAIVYVLSGEIEGYQSAGLQPHAAGDLFLEPPHDGTVRYHNRSGSEPAKILVFAATGHTRQ
ncbi:MAG: DUF3179 domain-containing (seleno)protein [Pseudomonadota bacterium]